MVTDSANPPRHTLRQEPLLHFALLAILVFAAHWAIAEPEPVPVIAVDEQELEEYRSNFADRHFRPPTPQELERFRQNRINEEILYREGLALGLDQDDPVIRARVISKMQLVLADEPSLGDPGDDVLADFLQQRSERYRRDARYSFELARLPDTEESVRTTLARAVANGADPQRAGLVVDRFRDRNAASISASFGPDFVTTLEGALDDQGWQEISVGRNVALLRVSAYQPATVPALDDIRARVLADWQRSRRVQQVNQQVAAMAESYDIRH